MTITGPDTTLHYAANGNFVNGVYAPAVDGFNLADVSSAAELDALPAGVKGLVYLGMTDGVTDAFKAVVDACKGNPNLYGFYLADEPNGDPTIAANLKAESDYIHANLPGAKTYMTEQNLSSNTSPTFYYTPANTGIDLFGLDPYPVQTNVPNNLDYNIIPLAVTAAENAGIPLSSIVPVYQAFGGGGYTTYILPTADQAQQILATWASVVPNPAFDYAYSWGTQLNDTALSNDPTLAAVFAAHNASSSATTTTTTTTTPNTPTTPTTPVAAPTVTITSVGATTTQASQTITGTVDLADAGSTVNVLDGTTKIGSATVAADGTWSAGVTLANLGSNVLTATDTNSGGTGVSNAVTFSLTTPAPAPAPTPTPTPSSATAPTVTIADTSLDVTGRGGTVDLGISVTAPDSASDVTVTIKGLPRYESITDGLGDRFHGSSITLTKAQVDSGLTLTSFYRGTGHPVATLSITASDTVGGVASSSASQSIVVTDPPPATSPATTNKLALLNQYIASGFSSDAQTAAMHFDAAARFGGNESFLARPQH
ncbi:hypothetical protein QM467_06830 [Rhodoblastus sp. 17X3]|uniref:hypothetical protein n=1 Tax=Rhodoblastus sp. 17X3 TaxID=3047026 RepID=UPI0024B64F57|nr:hypothetical protein [Rhodoblastus sp. 17X3]MDI9847766.1 hypothetical protein [Rhodoblastus sp. 17X3]